MSDWNARYQGDDYAFGTEPNEFVLSIIHHLPKSGRALDLATGEGRNGIFLAQHGLDTEGVDLSDVGLAKAERLEMAGAGCMSGISNAATHTTIGL